MISTLFNRIRLFVFRHKEPYSAFYKILGFCPRHVELYEQALTHRSAAICANAGVLKDNERLEFLGDAVFTAVTADYLYRHYPDKKEGFLSNFRSRIIQRETLNRIAVEIGLDKLVHTELRSAAHNNYIYGNAFEALIGAIYLDCGYEHCRRFIVERIFTRHIDWEAIFHTEVNFKSKLVEWGQHHRVDIAWKLDESTVDKNGSPLFKVRALVGSKEGPQASGYSKKEAQQKASCLVLQQIENESEFRDTVLHARKEASGKDDFIEKNRCE